MRASTALIGLLVGACGAEPASRTAELSGPERLVVDRLGVVDGPVVLMDDGTVAEGVSWSVAEAGVARVEGEAIHAVGPGETEVRGQWEEQELSWTLVVSLPVALHFDNPPARVLVGQAVALPLRVEGQGAVSWASSDPAVAAVDAAGQLTGLAPGLVYVTASAGATSAMVEVEVAAGE
jgi:hypothetical protein